MKNILLLMGAIMACVQAYAQCSTPLPNFQFNQQFRTIQGQTADADRLSRALTLAKSNCLSVSQVTAVSALFQNDYDRLEFAKEAYANTFDKANFYDVYNTFMYFSNVFRLHDHIKESGQEVSVHRPQEKRQPTEREKAITFPALRYPAYTHYKGEKGCENPLSERDFQVLVNELGKASSDHQRLEKIYEHAQNHCLSTAHLMKFATMIELESVKLNYLKEAYHNVYDLENFAQADQVFEQRPNKEDLAVFIKGQKINTQPEETHHSITVCEVTSGEMQEITETIKNQSFENTRINLIKQIAKDKKCFSVSQAKSLLGLLSFEKSKVDIAKYLYDYLVDPGNFYQLTNSFTFESSKRELNSFVAAKK